jgi:hypothetical protein
VSYVLCTPTVVVPEIFAGAAPAVVVPTSEPATSAVITKAIEENLIVFPSGPGVSLSHCANRVTGA